MKPRSSKLIQALGSVACTVWLAGCEVEAEEKMSVTNDSPAVAETGAGEDVGVQSPSGAAGTNAVSSTTNITNEQTVVIREIPPAVPSNLNLTTGVQEVVKLVEAGVSETVVLLYIEKYAESFELDAADILYLQDIGVSSTVIAAMLNHDGADPELHNTLTNTVEVATNELTDQATAAAAAGEVAAAPEVEITSNYVANATAPMTGPVPGADVGSYNPPAEGQQTVYVQEPAQIVHTAPATTYSYFYSSLAPYGSWIEVPDYGWCWQPTIARTYHGWRPYAHGGRWLYSNHGWYWQSDYSWGWAPFHYGRWYSAPHRGWVWVPDYTWGPSWVTWRRGPDYCGWAPLPPRAYYRPGLGFTYYDRNVSFSFGFGLSYEHYTFIPSHRFTHRRVVDHVIPTHRSRQVYNNSTVVNNYIVGNNNTIINNGIGRDYVAAKTRSEIRQVNVVEAPRTASTVVQPDRVLQAGDQAVVYRPSRPPAQLVQAHENLTRTRQESRVAGTPESPSRGTLVRPTQGRSESAPAGMAATGIRSTTPASEAAATSSGIRSSARSEASRPRIGDADFPVLPKPEPVRVRPEPAPLASTARGIRPTTSLQPSGSVVTQPRSTGRIGGLVNAQPSVGQPGGSAEARGIRPRSSTAIASAANPSTTAQSVTPSPGIRTRSPLISTQPGTQTSSSVRSEPTRNGAATAPRASLTPNQGIRSAPAQGPQLTSPNVPGSSTGRSESASRGVGIRQTTPGQGASVVSPSQQRQVTAPRTTRNETASQRVGIRPSAPVRQPNVVSPAPQRQTVTPAPTYSRPAAPAPSYQAPATAPSRGIRPTVTAPATVTPRTPAPSYGIRTPAPSTPAVTPSRSEPYRPRIAAPTYQPARPPVSAPAVTRPSPSPGIRSAPTQSPPSRGQVGIRQGTISGGSRPAPVAPSRAVTPSGGSSRGRLEIGR